MPPPRLILLDIMLPRMDGMLVIPYSLWPASGRF